MRKRRLCNYVASSLGVIRFGPVLLQREQYMYTYMHHCNNSSFCCTNMQIRSGWYFYGRVLVGVGRTLSRARCAWRWHARSRKHKFGGDRNGPQRSSTLLACVCVPWVVEVWHGFDSAVFPFDP